MEKLNIPKTLHVGYQERSGTYTGKLAYVIYEDHKGKKRKETSWQNWRHKKIEPDTFENVTTVLIAGVLWFFHLFRIYLFTLIGVSVWDRADSHCSPHGQSGPLLPVRTLT